MTVNHRHFLGALMLSAALFSPLCGQADEITPSLPQAQTESTAATQQTDTAAQTTTPPAAQPPMEIHPITVSHIKTKSGTWTLEGNRWKFKLKKTKKQKAAFAAKTFLHIDNKWYYFNKKGYVSKGWFKVGKTQFYANPKPDEQGLYGALCTGWTDIDGKTYYFSKKGKAGKIGALYTGWQTIKNKVFYFGKDGAMRTGLKKIKKKTYYLLPEGAPGVRGSVQTGWKTVNGVKYAFRKTGKPGIIGIRYESTSAKIGKKQYYFNADGTTNTAALSETAFVKTIGELARQDMKKTGILASVTTAQAILESAYGKSTLAVGGKNLFGMKANLSSNTWKSAWKGKIYRKQTWEHFNGKDVTIMADFRAYDNYAESLADHSAYLSGARKSGGSLRYAGVVGCKKYKKAAQLIKNGGYATDPAYVSKLCALIKRYNLTQYDK